ncbi:Gfo/Idh/MocA family protein [Pontiella sulfatireligans]|uniref:1,5-anhydro-D-fructose reductase n=1 Tax=Pontiella sulfatireligans TaxID=2750658 RepID=A0A6C2USA0_9BACT|nr:Gfo/Idh/MocA family oxidoreductase [Pontiella sulfatireligans]VGO22107.1 1,5-anhydro-D-fructose reductase [Pontiella sulfatireligans]
MKEIKWGIIGCGGIANLFATSLQALETGTLLAGASRTPGRAAEFAQKHGMERVYTDYEALVSEPDVDAVYIATTHNFHYENIKLCLENGKHVLCEKPFTVNAVQTLELIELAREKNLFMMEAVWTRFLPAILKLQELLADGVVGEVRTVKADFSITGEFASEHRLNNKALAGGALLDLGIYPITFASIVFGEQPSRIQSSAVIGDTGVDDRGFYLFDYEGGRRAMLSSSFTHNAPTEGIICGSKGYIRVPHFLGATQLQLHREGEEVEFFDLPYDEGENFKFEIAHAMECIEAKKLESDILPLSTTHAVMQTMDTLRAQWGLEYEGE